MAPAHPANDGRPAPPSDEGDESGRLALPRGAGAYAAPHALIRCARPCPGAAGYAEGPAPAGMPAPLSNGAITFAAVYEAAPRGTTVQGVGCTRKLVESIWRLFHWGECFDAAKPFGGIPPEIR